MSSPANTSKPLQAMALAGTLLVLLWPTSAGAQRLLGEDGFRISHAGPDGNALYDATHDGLAYNPSEDRYLVVWDADDRIPGPGATFNGKREIFARLLDGQGRLLSPQMLIASTGPSDAQDWDAENPEATYNRTRNEFFVVWVGTLASLGTTAKSEIFGTRVAANGSALGGPIRISQTGLDSNLRLDSREPSIAYNPSADEYLIVWQREESDNGSRVEHEVYARRVSGAGLAIGSQKRVSTMGPNGNTRFDALDPAVSYGSAQNRFLLVWRGDDDRPPLIEGEFEIFGQLLSATGAEIGTDDFRISTMGPARDTTFGASDPAIAYNPDLDEFLVTWTGLSDHDLGEQVYGQLLRSDGTQLGGNFAISKMGADGPTASQFSVDETLATYNPQAGEYFVIWIGEDDRELMAADEFEVFGQRLTALGKPLGLDDVRLSTLGPTGDSAFDPFSIDLAFNSTRNEYLVVFSGDDDRGTLVDDEVEIFGQRVAPVLPPCVDTEEAVCLSGGRFEVRASWRTARGDNGVGKAQRLSSDSGWFWFFDPANTELVVKVLDGRGINGKYWVFYGALSNVEYVVTVTDTETGEQREYRNPNGTFASCGDTGAFPLASSSAVVSASTGTRGVRRAAPSRIDQGASTCFASATTLCLNEQRFQVAVDWSTPQGQSGIGQARPLTSDTGWFWFFDQANTELVVKVLDGRGINGKYWVFFGALSNVEYTVTVTDTATGAVRRYHNPAGTFASFGDTNAFS